MTPLEQATIPDSEFLAQANATMQSWIRGDDLARNSFPGPTEEKAAEQIWEFLNEIKANELVFRNDVYQVNVRKPGPDMMHLSIRRLDRQPCHDWRDFQAIKNQIAGPEFEAIELYPAESRLVDTANQYHLWVCLEPGFRFPVGWEQGRFVSDTSVGKSVNRKITP